MNANHRIPWGLLHGSPTQSSFPHRGTLPQDRVLLCAHLCAYRHLQRSQSVPALYSLF